MQDYSIKKIVLFVIAFILIIATVVGLLIFFNKEKKEEINQNIITQEDNFEKTNFKIETVGNSVQGRKIEAYTFGKGDKQIVFVGGIHGGYEWNSTYLAYKFIDYLDSNPSFIPDNLTVTVIPSANPDGLFNVVKKDGRFTVDDLPDSEDATVVGRFNANNVDLNRNFDCKWKSESMWRGDIVSAGTSAFSEPEALAIKNFVSKNNPDAFIFWHSAAGAVYASECENGILPETLDIMNIYAKSAKYMPVSVFDAYEVTGDAEGWLASIGIPAITVELETHDYIDWDRNLAGIKAIFDYYKD